MKAPTLQTLGRMLKEKRGGQGIRKVAAEIGISHATLSRVERGFLPDLETFRKICEWLDVDPGKVLRVKSARSEPGQPTVSVHFRKKSSVAPETAQALANLILAAQRAMQSREPAEE